ncbi:hypothetical protein PEBR_24017 [Penicillium brasilianum]|uniref:Uncharacterized protein n=1 Tax=Penicillium brasilianum TaxID=104259 RepID=A0A1S9RKE5_PENBI|nr:hypothetical protein PEBR_24017 [Penicillium brasilianum]
MVVFWISRVSEDKFLVGVPRESRKPATAGRIGRGVQCRAGNHSGDEMGPPKIPRFCLFGLGCTIADWNDRNNPPITPD